MCVSLILFLFGIFALIKGQFKVTNSRVVTGPMSRSLGIVMLLGSILPFVLSYGAAISLGLMFIVAIIGLASSQPIQPKQQPKENKVESLPPEDDSGNEFESEIDIPWLADLGDAGNNDNWFDDDAEAPDEPDWLIEGVQNDNGLQLDDAWLDSEPTPVEEPDWSSDQLKLDDDWFNEPAPPPRRKLKRLNTETLPKAQSQSQKPFQFQMWQILTLAVLGMFACVILLLLGIAINSQSNLIAVNAAPLQISTSTPSGPTPTTGPTATPILTPTPTPIPGWQAYQGGPISLWLPPTFQGGDTPQHKRTILEGFRDAGVAFAPAAQLVEEAPDELPFVALDTDYVGTIVRVNTNQVTENIDLNAHMDNYIQDTRNTLLLPVTESARDIVSLDNYPGVGQLLLTVTAKEVQYFQLTYFIVDQDQLWIIAYSTQSENFGDLLPTFQQSAQTILLQEVQAQ